MTVHGKTELRLDENDIWNILVKKSSSFPARYRVYSYFRNKGFVVKSGVNFGVDFAVYRTTPEKCHSEMCVTVIDAMNESKEGLKSGSWSHLSMLTRVIPDVMKILLLCYVLPKEYQSPLDMEEEGNLVELMKQKSSETAVSQAVEKQQQQEEEEEEMSDLHENIFDGSDMIDGEEDGGGGGGGVESVDLFVGLDELMMIGEESCWSIPSLPLEAEHCHPAEPAADTDARGGQQQQQQQSKAATSIPSINSSNSLALPPPPLQAPESLPVALSMPAEANSSNTTLTPPGVSPYLQQIWGITGITAETITSLQHDPEALNALLTQHMEAAANAAAVSPAALDYSTPDCLNHMSVRPLSAMIRRLPAKSENYLTISSLQEQYRADSLKGVKGGGKYPASASAVTPNGNKYAGGGASYQDQGQQGIANGSSGGKRGGDRNGNHKHKNNRRDRRNRHRHSNHTQSSNSGSGGKGDGRRDCGKVREKKNASKANMVWKSLLTMEEKTSLISASSPPTTVMQQQEQHNTTVEGDTASEGYARKKIKTE